MDSPSNFISMPLSPNSSSQDVQESPDQKIFSSLSPITSVTAAAGYTLRYPENTLPAPAPVFTSPRTALQKNTSFLQREEKYEISAADGECSAPLNVMPISFQNMDVKSHSFGEYLNDFEFDDYRLQSGEMPQLVQSDLTCFRQTSLEQAPDVLRGNIKTENMILADSRSVKQESSMVIENELSKIFAGSNGNPHLVSAAPGCENVQNSSVEYHNSDNSAMWQESCSTQSIAAESSLYPMDLVNSTQDFINSTENIYSWENEHQTYQDIEQVAPCEEEIPASQSAYRVSSKRKRRKTGGTTENEGCKGCTCKKSQCSKLYCECFAAGGFCSDSCSCENCVNKPDNKNDVYNLRRKIESKNPLAFAPKIVEEATDSPEEGNGTTPSSARHKRGCTCKKSKCNKKYCECHQAKVGCSYRCRCEDCSNTFGKKEDRYRKPCSSNILNDISNLIPSPISLNTVHWFSLDQTPGSTPRFPLGSWSSLQDGHQLIWKSVPSFPSLTPYKDSNDSKDSNDRDESACKDCDNDQ